MSGVRSLAAGLLAAGLIGAPVSPAAARPQLAVAVPPRIPSAPALALLPPSVPRAGIADQTPATDFDDFEPAPDRPAITMGRALDLQGTALRLQTTAQRGIKGLFTAGRYLGPAVRPLGLPVGASGITSGFGTRWHPVLGGYRFHAGIDLPAAQGTAVAATARGSVVSAGWCGGYGWCVTLDHGRGIFTLYGHLSRIGVTPGQDVARGQELGRVGSTGQSTGPHLHYEVRNNGRPVDPASYLR